MKIELPFNNQFVFHAVRTGLVLDADLVAEWAGAEEGQAGSGRDQGEAV